MKLFYAYLPDYLFPLKNELFIQKVIASCYVK